MKTILNMKTIFCGLLFILIFGFILKVYAVNDLPDNINTDNIDLENINDINNTLDDFLDNIGTVNIKEDKDNNQLQELIKEEVIPEKVETIITLSDKIEKLPNTGPENIFLLIISSIIGAFLLIFRNKKA